MCYRNHSAKRTNVKAENKMEKTEQLMEFHSPCECNVHTENWDISLFLKILEQVLPCQMYSVKLVWKWIYSHAVWNETEKTFLVLILIVTSEVSATVYTLYILYACFKIFFSLSVYINQWIKFMKTHIVLLRHFSIIHY